MILPEAIVKSSIFFCDLAAEFRGVNLADVRSPPTERHGRFRRRYAALPDFRHRPPWVRTHG
jgi:hypothetical protein